MTTADGSSTSGKPEVLASRAHDTDGEGHASRRRR